VSLPIAERALAVRQADGTFAEGFVRLYTPAIARPDDPDSEWGCELQLLWPGFDKRKRCLGVDSYQALILAAQMVPTLVELTDEFTAGRLFECPDDPVPLNNFELSFGFLPFGGKSQ
jgi:hypothetical protein